MEVGLAADPRLLTYGHGLYAFILRKGRLIIEADERSQALTAERMRVAKLGYVKALNSPHSPRLLRGQGPIR